MEILSAVEFGMSIGEFPIFRTHINTIFDLAYLEGLRSIGMSYKGIARLEHGEGCYTLGISTCLGGLQYAHGVYSAFHSQGLTLPDDAFRKVDDGILFTGHADTWSEYASELENKGNTFIFRPHLDFSAWQEDPWGHVYTISFAFLPLSTNSYISPGLYVAYTD